MPSVIEANGSLSTWVNASEKRLVVIDFFATWYMTQLASYTIGADHANTCIPFSINSVLLIRM